MDALLQYGGLFESNLGFKLMCFGTNGVIVFQGSKLDVIMQLKEKHAPFMLGVHYVACMINLVVQIFVCLPLMFKIKIVF
jgi:hypothetical protein